MIKRLIFDIDNTLIEWKNEYWKTLEDVYVELNIKSNEEMKRNIIKAVDTYEEFNKYYNRENMLEHINKTTNYNFDINFLNAMLKKFEKCVPDKDEKLTNLLEYLSKKYELVILTNWFKDIQEKRLENFGILHYFSKIFAGETFKIKPYKESFIKAMENRTVDECIMIGDSFKNDIQGAINAGIKAIYITQELTKGKKENYTIINRIEELEELL